MTDLYAAALASTDPELATAASLNMVGQLAADRAKKLFGAAHAQAHPDTSAEAKAISALLAPGDTVLGPDLALAADLNCSPVQRGFAA